MLSVCHIAGNELRTNRIVQVKEVSPSVKALTLRDKKSARAMPGQFLMLWVPRIDEIPLSILNAERNGDVTVAVKNVGEATRAIHRLRVGDVIGVRGPFGNNFNMRKGRMLIVGGGTGTAPLLFLARKLIQKNAKLTFVNGAKTKQELMLLSDVQRACRKRNVVSTTEDGSYGTRCLATEPVDSLLNKEKFDMIYTCGPEKMMRKTFDLAESHGIPLEASLERLMRCAIGLCGSCAIGKYRVCRDGPVFTSDKLREVRSEFGISKRDFDGRRTPV